MVQLPIARSFIMAGVRVVAVQTISLATIATYIAAGGLGDIITRGISMINTNVILVPYYAVPIVRDEVLKEHLELEAVLNKLSGKITDAQMQA
jgi:ABC-type proline/glycine betaine transport system permease subunit